jgi:hypothetical protein
MSYSVPESAVVIMKRNSEGYYQRIVTYNVTSEVITTSTNGKWFAFSESDSTTHVFQVNDVHEVVQKKIFAGASSALQLLSDDSLAFVNGSALTTYHYADNTWTMSVTTQIYITFFPPYLYHLTDKTFAGIDYERSTVSLYRRKEDKSWALKDTFMIGNISEPLISIVWNGNDTVMLGCFAVEPIGAAWLYTKENEVWNEKVISAGSAIGIKPFGYLGFALLLVDPNTILVSAALDGYSSENAEQLVGGSVNVLSRDSGSEWQWNARLESELNAVYGLGLAVADEDILILGCGRETQNSTEVQCRYQSLPICFNQASQVTCNEINSCESISELEFRQFIQSTNLNAAIPPPLCQRSQLTHQVSKSACQLRALVQLVLRYAKLSFRVPTAL